MAFTFSTAEEEVQEILHELEELTEDVEKPEDGEGSVRLHDVGLVLVGVLGLAVGGRAIVNGATFLAMALGVSELVIGLTVVALGTSLPELATSVVAAVRKEADIAVGNVIGSNIFNLTLVLGTAGVVQGFDVVRSVLTQELPAVLFLSVLVAVVAASGRRVRRSEGTLLVLSYLSLTVWISLTA